MKKQADSKASTPQKSSEGIKRRFWSMNPSGLSNKQTDK